MTGPQSPLARFAHLGHEPDPQRAWDLASAAWHRDGIVCLSPAEVEKRLGWVAARMTHNLGEQAFGKRKAAK